jgi:hypothetical protein
MTINLRSASDEVLVVAGLGMEFARSIYDKAARATAGDASELFCGQVGNVEVAWAAGHSATANRSEGDTAQTRLRKRTRRIPGMPRLGCVEDARGEDAPEASVFVRAGRSLAVYITSLCGTKRNGFGHRVSIIAPANGDCRGISSGFTESGPLSHFILEPAWNLAARHGGAVTPVVSELNEVRGGRRGSGGRRICGRP